MAAVSNFVAPVAYAGSHESLMAAAGILPGDYSATDYIISHESGWDLYNWNGKSAGIPLSDNRACGLVQALPCSKIPWGDAVGQLTWFKGYCSNRYGSISGAYSFWTTHHYY